jgi:hypothetical protein
MVVAFVAAWVLAAFLACVAYALYRAIALRIVGGRRSTPSSKE